MDTSPLVERRMKPRLARPVTSPGNLDILVPANQSAASPTNVCYRSPIYEHRYVEPESPILMRKRLHLDTQSLSNSPCILRKAEKVPILQRYRSMSPTMCRKTIAEKLSPSSLRKSVMLKSSRRSDPVNLEICSVCGFPIREDSRISVSGKSGRREQFHAECFKCSV